MTYQEKIEVIERADALIRRKATGNAKEFARKLNKSESFVYRLIRLMRNIGAPIEYCEYRKSYYYKYEVEFSIGFSSKNLNLNTIKGGKSPNFIDFFSPLSKFDSNTTYFCDDICFF